MSNQVFINKIAKFLPNNPIENDEMEDYLGFLNGKRSRVKSIILRNNQIKRRHYARDKNGNTTHSNAELTAEAIKNLCTGPFKLSDIQLLTTGTTSPDQLLPAHAVMVHGLLNCGPVEAISFSGACCSGMNALKYAAMAVRSGETDNAVATGSERLANWMAAQNFEEEAKKIGDLENAPILSFEKEFLRWMLSDGAGAAWLSNKPNETGLSLKIEWIEIQSFANEVETCMYMAGEKEEDGSFKGWSEFKPKTWLENSMFALKQDTRLLDKYVAILGARSTAAALAKHGITTDQINWYLPHISSEYFRNRVAAAFDEAGIHIAPEKWFINLHQVGNIGAASIYVALEELMRSGQLQKGQRILLTVPESARFSYANALLTVY